LLLLQLVDLLTEDDLRSNSNSNSSNIVTFTTGDGVLRP